MLNNTDIIDKLSDEQKIALVADIYSAASDAFGAMGVPHLEKTELDTINLELGGDMACPDFSGLASSWDPKLVGYAAECVLSRADTARYNLIGTPRVGVKLGPCAYGMSEDPYLNAKMSDAVVSAISNAGAHPCITGGTVGNIDLDYLDSHADDAVIYDVLTRAADAVLNTMKVSAAELSVRALKGEWKTVNARIAEHIRDQKRNVCILRDAPEELFLKRLTDRDVMFTGASVSALRSAIKNYERMKEDVEHGAIGAEELEKAVAAGTAVSNDTLNAAVDKIIDYVKRLAPAAGPVRKTDDECRNIALFAARESIVLLKNSGVLPLRKGAKIALVGELAKEYAGSEKVVENLAAACGFGYVGFADGYKLDSERSDEALAAAKTDLAAADTVLVFVGLGRKSELKFTKHESTALPANQCAVLDEFRKAGKKVIAVVVGGNLPCMKFDSAADGLLLIPFGGGQTVKALCEIVFGSVCPSGRLTVSAFNDADIYFDSQKRQVGAGRYKIGGFIGYRRYISENAKVKYPFGFGLSYTKFVYSGLKITSGNIELNVKNTGSVSGSETVQLYVGKKSSAVVRPSRELKGFVKVFIEAGKSVHITFPLNSVMLEVFDRTDGKRKVEAGAYEIYVGSSCSDIRLTGSVDFSGVKIEKSVDKLSDYLSSVSNITADGYRMNAVSKGAAGQSRTAKPYDGDNSYAKLFADAFGADPDDDNADGEADNDEDIVDFLDESVTVKSTAEGLVKSALNLGVNIDGATACELVAAFYASRVVMLCCDKTEFDLLHMAVCGYFGCPVCIDDTSTCADSDDILGEGSSALVSAIAHAASHRSSITVAALDNVLPESIGKIFTQFIRYSTAPDKMRVTYGAAKRTLEVPRNMWFMMRLADCKCTFPAYVAEMSEVIIPRVSAVTAVDTKAYAPDIYQFLAACRRAENRYELDEPQWKKIDKLEEFAASRFPFKLGNKLCVQIERFAAALLECGVDPLKVLDIVVADKLVPHIASALEGKLKSDDGSFADILDGIFGSDDDSYMKLTARRAINREGV